MSVVIAVIGLSFYNLYIFTKAGVSAVLATVKRLPVLHYSIMYMFWSFVITEPIPDKMSFSDGV